MLKCVGIGKVKNGEYNGYAFSHIPVFLSYEDNDIDGIGTTKVNVPTKVGIGDLRVGDDCEVIYNRFGKVAGVQVYE